MGHQTPTQSRAQPDQQGALWGEAMGQELAGGGKHSPAFESLEHVPTLICPWG